MFIEALIFAVIIGYLTGGKLKNIGNVTIYKINFVFISFLIETIIIITIRKSVVEIGVLTYLVDLAMYIVIFYFIYSNRENKCILIIGIGFLLNAIPIFLNGGTMPVSSKALATAGLNYIDITKEGLYSLIDQNTNFWFLGDIIPKTFLRRFVVSIGDIVSAIGMMFFIIRSMKTKDKAIY